MAKKIFYTIFISLVIVSFGTAFADPDMNPGEWEITTETQMTGMSPQTQTHVQCLTNNDTVPINDEANETCRIEDIQVKGDTVTWEMTCGEGDEGGMNGTGWVTYKGDTMNGEMDMTIMPWGTKMKNTLTGRRIGDCDGSSSGVAAEQSEGASSDASDSAVSQALTEDSKEVGQAARDEAKDATKEEVREGVRGFFKGIFK